MIGRIKGTLIAKHPPQVWVDCHGVGYEIDVPMSTLYNLPEVGAEVTLMTHQVIREDAHLLFGFGTEGERSAFRTLLKVNGVGPKVALAILSGLSVAELGQAIALQDTTRLTKIPGIGKKTAERLVLELKDKMGTLSPGGVTLSGAVFARDSHESDICNALLSLGYNDREAASALKQLPKDIAVADGIRQALKLLAKG